MRGPLLTEASKIAPFLLDWRGRWQGRALAVAQPVSADDAASVVRWCNRHAVPIVPQGGNTGLSGGAVPDRSGQALVLSLARLTTLGQVDAAGGTLVAGAGCTLHAVQQAADRVGRLFPLSLASEGSCTVGGILSTNAGGVHALRYGSARALCLGLEVVTADGAVWNGLRRLAKDNSGLDLRDLFIGSEGTLGIITGAVLRLHPRPVDRVVAFAAVPSPEAALRLLAIAQRRAGDGLTACELMDRRSLELVLRHRPGTRPPVAGRSPWYVLLETSVWDPARAGAGEMAALLASGLDDGCVSDGVVAASLAQSRAFWALREAMSEAQAAEGSVIKHDVSLPIAAVPGFLEAAGQAVAGRFPGLRVAAFGHLGDGNVHYNVLPPQGRGPEHDDWLGLEPAVNRLVHDLVADRDGSVSAEHGLGVLRRHEAARYKSDVELRMMAAIKAALDPRALMNPGKGIAPKAGL